MAIEYSNLLKYTLTPPTATHYPDTRYMNVQYQAPDTRYSQHSNPQNASSQPFELHGDSAEGPEMQEVRIGYRGGR